MYHKVNPDRYTGGWGLRVDPREFEWQMSYLAARGYSTITPDQLWAWLDHGAPLPPKPVLITFDDGYRDNYVCAYPIMREYGFFATVFVVANAVERTNYFDVDTQPVNVMLSWNEIRALDAAGWTIGAHTLDHPRLTAVSPGRAEHEVRGAREVLAERLGRPVQHFCYPYGEFNDHTVQTVADSGYMLAFTTVQGRVEAGDDPHTLKRLRVTGRTSRAQFARLLESRHPDFLTRLAGGSRPAGPGGPTKENSPLSGEPWPY
ncbi:MAG: polysaccharide deacetylase family protein [Bacillota bacterium]